MEKILTLGTIRKNKIGNIDDNAHLWITLAQACQWIIDNE